MPPLTPTALELIVGMVLKYGPEAGKGIAGLFSMEVVTMEDLEEKLFKPARKSYEDYTKPK